MIVQMKNQPFIWKRVFVAIKLEDVLLYQGRKHMEYGSYATINNMLVTSWLWVLLDPDKITDPVRFIIDFCREYIL